MARLAGLYLFLSEIMFLAGWNVCMALVRKKQKKIWIGRLK
jgi:hypothetical protein